MDPNRTHLGLPLLAPSQAQKHVTINESILALDVLVGLRLQSVATLTVPPGAPDEGDCHIVANSATRGWMGQDGKIACWQDAAWRFRHPVEGLRAWRTDTGELVVYAGGEWKPILPSTPDQFDQIAVGTAPQPGIGLLAHTEAVLLTAPGDGENDIRLTLNKATPSSTAALLFQTGFSGRAEIGLTGGHDLAFKVSADGNQFDEAVTISADTRRVCVRSGLDTPNVNGAPLSGRRNLLINGDFAIAQRATSSGVAYSPRAIDRWYFFGGNATLSRQAATGEDDGLPEDATFFARADVTMAGTYQGLAQKIEDVTTAAGATVSLSFCARAAAGSRLTAYLFQNFGSGGSSQRTVGIKPIQIAAEGWTRHEVQFQLPGVRDAMIGNASNLILVLYINAGATDQTGVFDFAQIQLERGHIATGFEPCLPQVERALCERYFRKLDVLVPDSPAQLGFIDMLRAPTITGGGPGFDGTLSTAVSLIAHQTAVGLQTLALEAEL